MIVTIAHVGVYAGQFEPEGGGGKLLGLLYAIAVEASVAVCAYFTAWATTRKWAWAGFIGFTLASGVMNWGYIEPTSFPAWVYALFPTAAIALLGFLFRQVDVLTKHGQRTATKPEKVQSEPMEVRGEPERTPDPVRANYQQTIWGIMDDAHEQGEPVPAYGELVKLSGASKATVSKRVNAYPNGKG